MADEKGEASSLLEKEGSDTPPPPYEATEGVRNGNGGEDGKKRSSGKRLQRNPSLDKVDEDPVAEEREKDKCPPFGVKSYLHQFYDNTFYRDPEVYEDDDELHYLLRPQRRRRCAAVWWKVFVWIGANFLVFGIVGVLVGYLVPQRQIFINKTPDQEVIDSAAMNFNFNLNVCKLVGLVLFCIGGLTLTIALLFPSFLYNYCEDERMREKPIAVRVGDQPPPRSPVEMTVPYSSKVSEVQPGRNGTEAVVTREGMLPVKE